MHITQLRDRNLDTFDLYLITTTLMCARASNNIPVPVPRDCGEFLTLDLDIPDLRQLRSSVGDDDLSEEVCEIAAVCIHDEVNAIMGWAWAEETEVGMEILTTLRMDDIEEIVTLAAQEPLVAANVSAAQAAADNLPIGILAQI